MAEPGLRRVLGPVAVTASGVGIIIGAGIYVLLGPATDVAGPAVWASFGMAAALCALTGLSYAELASMYPRAGAEFDFAGKVFGPRVTFTVGWTMTFSLMVAAATIALGVAQYLQLFVRVPLPAAAIGLLIAEAGLARTGIARSARLSIGLSALQVAGLLVVIALGVGKIGSHELVGDSTPSSVIAGAALVFFAFIGFDEVVTLSEETRDAARVIPRALLWSLGISTALYVGVAVSAVSVLGADALGASPRALGDVVEAALGVRAQSAIGVIALISTTNTSLLALTACSRMLYGMAEGGALSPRVLRVSSKTGAPVVAIAVALAGAALFATVGDLRLIAGVTDFGVYCMFLVVNAIVVVLRRREPDRPRPFRVPGAIRGVPVLPIAGFAAAALLLPRLSLASIAWGTALVVAGAGSWPVLRPKLGGARDSVSAQ